MSHISCHWRCWFSEWFLKVLFALWLTTPEQTIYCCWLGYAAFINPEYNSHFVCEGVYWCWPSKERRHWVLSWAGSGVKQACKPATKKASHKYKYTLIQIHKYKYKVATKQLAHKYKKNHNANQVKDDHTVIVRGSDVKQVRKEATKKAPGFLLWNTE